ncbi:hypothetical protein JW960_17115 [candidate division KSB1 bacterium]|nr:hypothetical protein [candidate division KSB1 bacterium]
MERNSTNIEYNFFLKRLQRVRNHEKMISLFAGLLRFVAWSAGILLLFLTFEWIFQFDQYSRIVIDISAVVAIMVIALYHVGLPVFRILFRYYHPSLDNVAMRVGEIFPAVRDRLVNALQVYRNYSENKDHYAPDLVRLALDRVHEQTKDLDFFAIVNRKPISRGALQLIGTMVIVVPLLAGFRTSYRLAVERLLHPSKEFQSELPFKLSILPGNTQILKDENVDIKISGEGSIPSTLHLHVKNVATGYENVVDLTNRQNKFFYTLERVKDSTQYYVTAPNFVSYTHSIKVVELPMVRHLQVRLNYPAYSRLEQQFLDDNVGDITALKGTRAYIHLEANKQIEKAELIFERSAAKALDVHGTTADVRFTINNDDIYSVKLSDRNAYENQNPIAYRIQVVDDNSPLIRITEPGEDVDISDDMQLPIRIEAEDDFGFNDLKFYYRLLKSNFTADTTTRNFELTLENRQIEKLTHTFIWDLSDLNLYPEDIVAYYAIIRDNDTVSGPKPARSLTYHVRFPSILEMYDEVEKEQDMTYESVEGMYEQSKELKEKLSDLVQEMKKDPNLNWEEQKQLEDAVKTQQELQQTLQNVEQQLDEMIRQMEKNDLMSVETLKKYMELQNLIQEMMTDELKQAMEELQKAMENVDPDQLKQAVENLDINQEEFLKNIEKTLSLLKRLQAEQKLDEVAKKVESMLEQQNDINQKAGEADQTSKDQLAGEQQKLEQDAASLEKDLSKLQQTMNEFSDMPTEDLQNTQDMMQDQQLMANMNQAKQQFQQGNFQKGQQSGQKSQQTLSQMMSSLQMAKQKMLQQQKDEILAEMRRMNHDLLQLSKKQEDVMESTKSLGENSTHIEEMADSQQDLVNGLQRVTNQAGKMENKSFFMTPQITRSIGSSLMNMQNSIGNIEARNMPRAARDQGHAMAALNDAVKQIFDAMQQLSSAQSSSGLQNMMQQMSQMAQQQQGINQQTMQLGMGQLMTMEQQAAMARLAAQQAALKKSMEQLAQEYGGRSDVLGDLNQIAKDMDDVARDLKGQNLTRQTYNRQRRILSRLLDAQKSMQRREYSKKRQAETGKYYIAKNPGMLPANLGERNLQFRQDILKAMKEGYTKDYQELIKKYFEALVNEGEQDN